MITEDDLEATQNLVNMFLKILNHLETPQQVAMAACARLFAQVCTDCNLNGEQFLHLCNSIAVNNEWQKQEVECGKAE